MLSPMVNRKWLQAILVLENMIHESDFGTALLCLKHNFSAI